MLDESLPFRRRKQSAERYMLQTEECLSPMFTLGFLATEVGKGGIKRLPDACFRCILFQHRRDILKREHLRGWGCVVGRRFEFGLIGRGWSA